MSSTKKQQTTTIKTPCLESRLKAYEGVVLKITKFLLKQTYFSTPAFNEEFRRLNNRYLLFNTAFLSNSPEFFKFVYEYLYIKKNLFHKLEILVPNIDLQILVEFIYLYSLNLTSYTTKRGIDLNLSSISMQSFSSNIFKLINWLVNFNIISFKGTKVSLDLIQYEFLKLNHFLVLKGLVVVELTRFVDKYGKFTTLREFFFNTGRLTPDLRNYMDFLKVRPNFLVDNFNRLYLIGATFLSLSPVFRENITMPQLQTLDLRASLINYTRGVTFGSKFVLLNYIANFSKKKYGTTNTFFLFHRKLTKLNNLRNTVRGLYKDKEFKERLHNTSIKINKLTSELQEIFLISVSKFFFENYLLSTTRGLEVFYFSVFVDSRLRVYYNSYLGFTQNKLMRACLNLDLSDQGIKSYLYYPYHQSLSKDFIYSKLPLLRYYKTEIEFTKSLLKAPCFKDYTGLYFFTWFCYFLEVGKFFKKEFLSSNGEYNILQIVNKGFKIITSQDKIFKKQLSTLDLDEYVLVKRIRRVYFLNLYTKTPLSLLFTVPVSLDAIASGNQNLSLVLGVKKGYDYFINLNSEGCFDTYTVLINQFLSEYPNVSSIFFNRSFLKKIIMTLNYSASYQTLITYFKGMIDASAEVKFNEEVKAQFKLFYNWLKHNNDTMYKEKLSTFKKGRFRDLNLFYYNKSFKCYIWLYYIFCNSVDKRLTIAGQVQKIRINRRSTFKLTDLFNTFNTFYIFDFSTKALYLYFTTPLPLVYDWPNWFVGHPFNPLLLQCLFKALVFRRPIKVFWYSGSYRVYNLLDDTWDFKLEQWLGRSDSRKRIFLQLPLNSYDTLFKFDYSSSLTAFTANYMHAIDADLLNNLVNNLNTTDNNLKAATVTIHDCIIVHPLKLPLAIKTLNTSFRTETFSKYIWF